MSTGPQQSRTSPQAPRPGGGRGNALLLGGLSFSLVFLLIVGATVAYLVLRPGASSGPDSQSASSSASATSTDSESPTPTDAVEERCYTPEYERASTNPSGKLLGGGLQFIPPAVFDGRESDGPASFLNDTQVATALVEEGWISSITVGAVDWQPGVEYPGNEIASQKIAKCFFTDGDWGDNRARERTWDEETTTPVTIAGMPGYTTRAIVNFGSDDLEKTDATEIVVVVLETEQGPSALALETAVGVTDHEEAADAALESLTGLGS
ncbi:hypothetical protein [Brachybacterium tyrofermentans]|uniref:hypothetical protein n=1 Tax=Brachybacterium tyrofermentans TaxID=47848 RepID=UPI003FD103D8